MLVAEALENTYLEDQQKVLERINLPTFLILFNIAV
jgi:hypothetical protein